MASYQLGVRKPKPMLPWLRLALYLDNFARSPTRELVPTRRRNGNAHQVWVCDLDGRRLLAYVATRDGAIAFAVRSWLARPSAHFTVERWQRGVRSELIEVGRLVSRRRAQPHGDRRDTWRIAGEVLEDPGPPPPELSPYARALLAIARLR